MKNKNDKNQELETEDTTEPTRSRRKVIKSVAALGGGLAIGESIPDKWHRPFVDAVLLPAHAQTSDGGNPGVRQSDYFGGEIGYVASNSLGRKEPKSLASTLTDFVVANARAHTTSSINVESGCANLQGSSVDVSLNTNQGSLTGQGQVGEQIPLGPNPQGSIRDAFITLTTLTDSNVSPAVITRMDYDLIFDIVDEGSDTTHADQPSGTYGRVGSWNKSETPC